MKIKSYSRIPKKYYNTLWYSFTYETGRMRIAMSGNNIKCVFIAFDDEDTIMGWSAVYEDQCFPFEPHGANDCQIGVFVSDKHRHSGLGSKLRSKGILWCARKKKLCIWYDMKKDWQHIFIAPNEISLYQLRITKIVAKDMGMIKEHSCQTT